MIEGNKKKYDPYWDGFKSGITFALTIGLAIFLLLLIHNFIKI